MSRVAIADHSMMSLISLRRGLNRAVGRMKAVSFGLPAFPGRGDKLLIAPQDLRTADPTRAAEIYGGRFVFASKVVVCDGRSPFEMLEPSEEWGDNLLGFGWLRHLRAADSAITRANARALVEEWISLQGTWRSPAWKPEVVTRRVVSWLSQAPVILDDSDDRFYRRFVRSLGRQIRYLRSTANDTRDGAPRLQARIALTYAALCVASQLRHLRRATNQLAEEIERQILPDGGHASRNPQAVIDLLLDLLPLSQVYTARNVSPPPALLNAIDRMMPMLRFFRHTDGTLALFNGMGPTPSDVVATLVAYDDTQGKPVANAVHSGYQRVEAGPTIAILEAGVPPPKSMSAEANAGCLSFELSSRAHRIIVNSGIPSNNKDNWRETARATSSHSTVTFNHASSCTFAEQKSRRKVVGVQIASGPTYVPVARETEDDAIVLQASHDGYASRFNIIHQRTLAVSSDGHHVDGEELFLPAKGDILSNRIPDEFAVRFLLHPTIRANKVSDGHGAMLILPNKDVWTFLAQDDAVEIEEGAYLGGQDGPRRTLQIVIYGNARSAPRVRWSLNHSPQASAGGRRPRSAEDPQLPL